MTELPQLALSIMQPWAWLIVNGHKDIENRKWSTKFRGLVAIHAGKKIDGEAAFDLAVDNHPATGAEFAFPDIPNRYQTGGIVGVAEIVDCVRSSESEWFVGKYGFVIRNARPVEFIPVRGELAFFEWRKNLSVTP
ncbi:ASCH domain-containing protein [Agrobacterium tumefaciens]|uniref:ASCH domain-containing protein n=1 Tax=Agrobacterium tumefaciens TaxID=358 RepID=UPI0015735749|nr:ASCH domain-containing protein [Agrobacterium tumefaciens]